MEERIGDRLKILVAKSGLTQKELAGKAHLTEASLSKYLSGAREPHLKALASLAEALGVSSDELLGIEPKAGEAYAQAKEAIEKAKTHLTSEEKMSLILLLSQN